MNFKPEMVEAILAGRKTVTRRPATSKARYEEGKDYSVCPGRGRYQVARIQILDNRVEMLGKINDEDARREGFADRAAFVAYWQLLYGRFYEFQPVRRIEFRLVGRE